MGTPNHFQQKNNQAACFHQRRIKLDDSDYSSKRRKVDSIFGVKITTCHTTVTNTAITTILKADSSTDWAKTSEKIIDMNNIGIGLFENDDFLTAFSLFHEAASMQLHSSLSSKLNGTLKQKQTSKTGLEPPTSSYIYQRMVFDEGMDVFTKVELVNLECHPVAVQATLLFNAAQARRRLKDYGSARFYYEKALQILLSESHDCSERPFCSVDRPSFAAEKAVHPVVVPIAHNIGLLAYRQGHLDEAIKYCEMALNHSRVTEGPDNVSVGRCLNCLGVLFYHCGVEESSRALFYFRDALRILSCNLGPGSAEVATTLNNLGRVMVQTDDFLSALDYYERALGIRRKTLGCENLDYAATAFNAGQSLHQLGDYDRAIILYQEFLRVASLRFSKNHRDVAVVLSGIAQIHQERKDYVKARQLHEESLRVGRAALGNYHSEVAMLLNRIGNFYFEQEEFDDALKAYKEGLQIEKKVLDKSHPNVIVTLSNIGEIYRQKGMYRRAIKIYTEAMKLQKIRHGENCADVAGTLNVIGLIHDQKGESDLALKRLQEALVIRRTVLGDDHLEVAATLTYLGTMFFRRNAVSTALQLLSESLRIRTAKLGSDHRDISFTLYNIGLCHQLQGAYKESIACFQETLRIELNILGECHRDVGLTCYKLGEAYRLEGDLDMALKSFQSALTIERKILEKKEPSTIAKTLNEIGNIYLAQGDVVHMMEAFTESARLYRRAGLLISSISVSPVLKLYAVGFDAAAAAA